MSCPYLWECMDGNGTKDDSAFLREEIRRLRSSLSELTPPLEVLLKRRGFRIYKKEPADDLLLPKERHIEQYYDMLKRYSFRLFLREVIKHQNLFTLEQVTRYATSEVTEEYVKYLKAIGLLKETAEGFKLSLGRIKSFGETLEWFIAEIFRREFMAEAIWGIRFKRPQVGGDYDLVVASQPWRARMPAALKAEKILKPLIRSLRAQGRMLAVQSTGRDPGFEIIREIWPKEEPFTVDRHELVAALRELLGEEAGDYAFDVRSDDGSMLSYHMHTLPSEIGESIGTSTLFAAWNAAIYVAQIEDDRLEEAISSGSYLESTAKVLQKFGGLWFNDETFVISRR